MTLLLTYIGIRTGRVKHPVGGGRTGTRRSALALLAACASMVLAVSLAWPTVAAAALKTGDQVGALSGAAASRVASDFPGLSMKSGMLVTSDGRVLWSRAPEQRRAMASITKIMTALVVLERLSLDDTASVPSDAVSVGESEAGLKAGEALTVSDLLEALLVESGNDAAVTLAERVAGSEKAFVELMNEKAGQLGLANTRFANAHGLDEPGHYSTAADLAVLSRHAMTLQPFRDIVGLRAARIGTGSTVRMAETSNKLIGSYRGATGVKTGWTSDAGYSLIASAERDGIELTAVVLGTGSESVRFSEAKKLLDWGFKHYRPQRVVAAGSTAGRVAVTDYIDRVVPAIASRDETAVVFDLDGPLASQTRLVAGARAPVERGERLGSVAVTQSGRLVATVPAVAAEDVSRPGLVERVTIGVRRLWLRLVGRPTTAQTAAVS